MYPEGLFPRSQEPTIYPYSEPDQSILCPLSPFHFLKIHCNIILPSTPGSSKWSLSHRLPHPSTVSTSDLPHTCYMPHPSHSSSFVNTCNPNISSFSCTLTDETETWIWKLYLSYCSFCALWIELQTLSVPTNFRVYFLVLIVFVIGNFNFILIITSYYFLQMFTCKQWSCILKGPKCNDQVSWGAGIYISIVFMFTNNSAAMRGF